MDGRCSSFVYRHDANLLRSRAMMEKKKGDIP